jgi:hypothetical protein
VVRVSWTYSFTISIWYVSRGMSHLDIPSWGEPPRDPGEPSPGPCRGPWSRPWREIDLVRRRSAY